MKKTAVFLAVMLFAACAYAAPGRQAPKAPKTPEELGDACYALRNSITDTAKAAENMAMALEYYGQAMAVTPVPDALFRKYFNAYDFRYKFFVNGSEEKKAAYKTLIEKVNARGYDLKTSAEGNLELLLAWGRLGDSIENVFEAAGEGIAGKIKEYGENLYALDKTYDNYAACISLGRLHYKAPVIPFILTWPDKNRSKDYLAECLKGDPANLLAKFYLADTLWDLDKKEEAKKLYKEVLDTAPRSADYYYDLRAKEDCAKRVKDIGVSFN